MDGVPSSSETLYRLRETSKYCLASSHMTAIDLSTKKRISSLFVYTAIMSLGLKS